MLIYELTQKILARSKSFSAIFIFNFCLAIAALSYLQFFKASVNSSLDAEAKSLLGADLVVNSRFPISDNHIVTIEKSVPKIKNFSEGLSTVSMISSGKRARLMEVVRASSNYPFYGGLTFQDDTQFPSQNIMLNDNEIWVYKEVLELLDAKKGEQLKIGKEQFTISKVITEDTAKAVSFVGFMPKIYMSKAGLEKSGLLQFGSTARYKLHYQFEKQLNNDELQILEDNLEASLDQNLHVLSPNDGRDRLLNVLKFITNFLSLVSLISFFLGLVGLIYLYSGFLKEQQKDIMVLNDLGLKTRQIAKVYLLHLFTLVFFATVIVFATLLVASQFLAPMIKELINFDFGFAFDYSFFTTSLIALILLTLSIGLPLILPLLRRESNSTFKTLLSFAPFFAVLLGLSHFVVTNKFIGLYFALAVLVLIAIIFILGLVSLKQFDFSGHLNNLSLSLAIKNITREKKTSLTLFTAILLCTVLFSLIPQVGTSLSNGLINSAKDRPQFFVIDAKEEEIDRLKTQVAQLGGNLENITPMIRAQVIKVNDQNYTQHSEKHGSKELKKEQNELQNATVNLSYRERLKPSEQLVEGREFSGVYDSPDFSKTIELSVEKRYAQRRGLKLGDEITFDVLGLPIKTKIVNIRTVEWIEFTPNFFFVLQPGAIDDAPKTILATIGMGEYNPTEMIIELTNVFPSLTLLNVKEVFETFTKLVDNVTIITDRMSFYSITIGLLMSFIIINYQMKLQTNNILRLKMIGLNHKSIKNAFLIEYGLITFVASALGVLLGSVGSYYISDLLFEAAWDFRTDVLFAYLFFIPLLTLLIVRYFTSKIINKKENVLFGE